MIFHNIQQNTDEWFQLRAGNPTSSKLNIIMAHYGKAFSDAAKKYAVDIAVERITGNPVSSGYSNSHMDRGHEEEPLARILYEEDLFCDVDNGGFFQHENFGCSPDGLVSDCGVIEIKSAVPSVHYDRIRKQSFDTAYKWQLIGNMVFTGRDWIDFVSYCSSFPEDKRLFVKRLNKADYSKEIEMITARLGEFQKLIDSTLSTISSSNYFLAA